MRLIATLALIATTLLVSLEKATAKPLEERSIVAFTPEPNDLGKASDFFQKFPRSRCHQKPVSEKEFLYICHTGTDIDGFGFNLEYDDATMVLTFVEFGGEPVGFAAGLKKLQRILVPELVTNQASRRPRDRHPEQSPWEGKWAVEERQCDRNAVSVPLVLGKRMALNYGFICDIKKVTKPPAGQRVWTLQLSCSHQSEPDDKAPATATISTPTADSLRILWRGTRFRPPTEQTYQRCKP
jgi:hypothetical protein